LTTNQSVYQPGQPIELTFTETNTSSQPVTVAEGPSIDGFDVTQNGKPVWQSNAGINPLFLLADPLQPGQSLTLQRTWDGVPTPGEQPIVPGGTFTVTNQLDPQGASATFQIESSSPSSSLTTDQSVYQAGEPVQITFTETNTSSVPIIVDPGGNFSVTNAATNVTVFTQGVDQNAQNVTLQPGQSLTQTATWNATQPGTYDLAYQGASVGADGSIQVTSAPSPSPPLQNQPLVSVSVTTKHQEYRKGETVVMTLTLKNTSSQSVAVPPSSSSDGFSVLAGSTEVWHSARRTRTAKARTLSPGESITVHAVWNSKSSPRAANKQARVLYTVEASEGGYSAATTIQIDP